jgi:hypothetical protein
MTTFRRFTSLLSPRIDSSPVLRVSALRVAVRPSVTGIIPLSATKASVGSLLDFVQSTVVPRTFSGHRARIAGPKPFARVVPALATDGSATMFRRHRAVI